MGQPEDDTLSINSESDQNRSIGVVLPPSSVTSTPTSSSCTSTSNSKLGSPMSEGTHSFDDTGLTLGGSIDEMSQSSSSSGESLGRNVLKSSQRIIIRKMKKSLESQEVVATAVDSNEENSLSSFEDDPEYFLEETPSTSVQHRSVEDGNEESKNEIPLQGPNLKDEIPNCCDEEHQVVLDLNRRKFPHGDILDSSSDQDKMSRKKSEGQNRERKRVFGFSSLSFGLGFTGKSLNKVFSTSKKNTSSQQEPLLNSREPEVVRIREELTGLGLNPISTTTPHSLNNNNNNNELDSEPRPRQQLVRQYRLSSVSKSSSESNIPLCHNSLENLTDDLPSSCSTDDSDGILPILASSIHNPGNNNQPSCSNTNMTTTSLRRNSCDDGTLDPVVTILHEVVGGSSRASTSTQGTVIVESVSQTIPVSSTSGGRSNNSNIISSCHNRNGTSGCDPCQFLGPKFKLITEGDIQVCKIKHGQNLMAKLASSKLLRRWETHHIYLNDLCISSKTPIGSLTTPISYWQMEEVYVVVRWDLGRRYIIRIVLPDGSLLLQAPNVYGRDQLYYSIIWKKNIFKYQNLMRSSKRPEVIMKELKSLVDFATTTPLQDDCISHIPIEIVSNLLDSAGELLGKSQSEEVLVALSPLLEKSHPPPALCRFFSRHCQTRPRCPLVAQLFTPVVRRALKHNADFVKCPHMRRFIQDFFLALNSHNDGINVVRNFVKSNHGPASSCPHPKVMSNLVSISLAAIFAIFERNNAKRASNFTTENTNQIPWDEQLLCYLAIFDAISEFDDWRPNLAQLLQPIPFPDDALTNPLFTRSLSSVIRRIGTDHRCDVHQMVMGIRDGKEGWFHIYSPSNLACLDDFELWALMLERLLRCCCRRKRFLSQLGGKLLGSCQLLALREHQAAQEALCLLLEWQLVSSDDQRIQIASTLQSTPSGSANYLALCGRQLHLKELQQKGGPRKLTLPSRSTDADLAKLLSCGSLGNLECLSLAFTQVTSACAEQLIKLPSLRYLNLWSTQFGDSGLQLISEHLTNLQVLNLCETPVSDKGLLSLTCMASLRKLNLNSTNLSAGTYERIRQQIPGLKEVDIRYTEAW